MTIIEKLLSTLTADAPVRSVLVGVHCTAVCADRVGLACTVRGEHRHCSAGVRDVGRLHERGARELAELARSDHPLEASIGVAALNALLPFDRQPTIDMNGFDLLARHGAGRRVALVGHFPFVPRLREAVGTLWVLELHPSDGDHPASAAGDLIPQADVVGITGSALVNHTLDSLLSFCRPDAFVVMLGPSTPASPLLFDHGVDVLAGAAVVDERLVLAGIAQGASFRDVRGVRMLALARPGATC